MGWNNSHGGTDQGDGQLPPEHHPNGVPLNQYELAASKPLNSSRGIMSRRFQKHQPMVVDHQRQLSGSSNQAALQQYATMNFAEAASGSLFTRDSSNMNKNKLMKSNQHFSQMPQTVNRSLNLAY